MTRLARDVNHVAENDSGPAQRIRPALATNMAKLLPYFVLLLGPGATCWVASDSSKFQSLRAAPSVSEYRAGYRYVDTAGGHKMGREDTLRCVSR